MEKQIKEIKNLEKDYFPNEEVQKKLGEITMVLLIGPAAVGKSTVMDKIAEKDSDFAVMQSFTTRERREGEPDDLYRFYPHNSETIENLVEKAENRQLVQFAIHPTTGRVYGSEIEDYKKPFMLLDTLSNAVADIEKLPFKNVEKIAVVAPPEQWEERLSSRTAADEHEKRIKEAKISLDWCAAQGDELAWVNNPEGAAEEAAEEIMLIAKQNSQQKPKSQEVGRRLLNYVNQQL